jgi:large subunit ribosomal protein L16
MAIKKKSNTMAFSAPNKLFKNYHKLYVKSKLNLEYSKKNYMENELFGIVASEYLKLTSDQLEACKRVAKRIFKKKGTLLPRVYTYLPLTKKPSETRMGKGKSSRVSSWVCPIKQGKIIFTIQSKNYDLVKEVYKAITDKLPIKLIMINLNL